MLETNITRKLFIENFEDERENGIVDSEEVIVILNPTQYTVRDEDIDEEDQV